MYKLSIITIASLIIASISHAGTMRIHRHNARSIDCEVKKTKIANRGLYRGSSAVVNKGNYMSLDLECSGASKIGVVIDASSYAEASLLAKDLRNPNSSSVFYSVGENTAEGSEELKMTFINFKGN